MTEKIPSGLKCARETRHRTIDGHDGTLAVLLKYGAAFCSVDCAEGAGDFALEDGAYELLRAQEEETLRYVLARMEVGFEPDVYDEPHIIRLRQFITKEFGES